jgi:hypothetical protein
MTKQKAKNQLQQGKRISHHLFQGGFIFLNNNLLLDEGGNLLDWQKFWKHKHNEFFELGWYLV